MPWFCRIWNIFAQMFIFVVVGFSKCKSLYLNECEKCYWRQIYTFNPHKMVKEMYYTYTVISENTLQYMLSNLHEFLSEVGTVVCFGQ